MNRHSPTTAEVPTTDAEAAHPSPYSSSRLPSLGRRNDLDWLRAIAIVLLLIFHSAMPFNAEWKWHINNVERSNLLLEFSFFLSRWRMALLFVISGVGTSYALRSRTGAGYLKERGLRLAIPVLFGMAVLIPPQVFAERSISGVRYESFAAFLGSHFDGKFYPDGNLSWHHLWFVVYLLTYSIIGLPFFLWLRTGKGRQAHDRIDDWLGSKRIYWLSVPMAVAYAALIQAFHSAQDLIHDWAMYLLYFCTFVYGYVLGEKPKAWAAIEKYRHTSLSLAFASLAIIDILRWTKLEPGPGYTVQMESYLALTGATPWFWVLAILGYSRRILDFDHPVLEYAKEAAYPFYILHQTIVVGIAYYVVQLNETVFSKFFFLTIMSFMVTLSVYHLYIRPYPAMRFLFGMKDLPKSRKSLIPDGDR